MRLRTLIETSIAVKLIRKSWRGYGYFEELLSSTSKTSSSYKIMLKFWDRLKLYSRYSFLGRVSEVHKRDAFFIVSESKVINYIRDSCNKLKKGLSSYFNTSILNELRGELKNEFYSYPLKVISIIIIVSALTNIFLTILLKRELTMLDWIIRAVVFFTGLTALNSNVDWVTIQNDSIVLRLILRKRCAGSAER